VLAAHWWFWVLAGLVAGGAAVASGRYRALAAAVRRAALERRLVEPPPGRRIDTGVGGFASDLSWLLVLLGAWVALSPWIWGYADVSGAPVTDLVTGVAVTALGIAGIVFPSLNALLVLGGLWLVTAPWLVGYGSEGGPIGLSDTLAGVAIAALALAALTAAGRRVAAEPTMPVGRVRRRRDG
jgi:SPW repeat